MRINAKVSLNSFNNFESKKKSENEWMSLNKVLENYLDTQIWKPCNRIKEKSGAEMIKNTEKSYECKICMDNQLIVAL